MSRCLIYTKKLTSDQGCTDAAPRPAHPRPTRQDAATREGRRRPRVRPASCRVAPRGGSRLGPTRADVAKTGADAAEIGPNRPKSGRLGPYRPATDTADTAETGRNRPKQAEIGRENRRRGRNSGLRCVSCLILSLFCESSILMCFLRIF